MTKKVTKRYCENAAEIRECAVMFAREILRLIRFLNYVMTLIHPEVIKRRMR
jgi:hypothetical protein